MESCCEMPDAMDRPDGIILFTFAVIPMLNHSGGMQMFNAEVSRYYARQNPSTNIADCQEFVVKAHI